MMSCVITWLWLPSGSWPCSVTERATRSSPAGKVAIVVQVPLTATVTNCAPVPKSTVKLLTGLVESTAVPASTTGDPTAAPASGLVRANCGPCVSTST